MRLTYFLKEGKGIKALSTLLLMINLFIFGYLAGLDKNRPRIVVFEAKSTPVSTVSNGGSSTQIESEKPAGELVASKSGTRIYYIWCSGVNRIKPENRVYFATLDDALKKGYKPASNCPGM